MTIKEAMDALEAYRQTKTTDNLEEAIVFAIGAMDTVIQQQDSRMSLIPDDVLLEMRTKLEAYEALGTIEDLKIKLQEHESLTNAFIPEV